MAELGAERSHASVLAAAHERIRADAAARGLARTVVIAHAFVTGGQASESERDIRVGGIGDAPASALAGCSYLALGHLHGQQRVGTGGATTARYCGSPLAFSFSERHHHKSVTLAEIDGDGAVTTQCWHAGAAAAPRGTRPPRRPARPGRRRPGRPGRRLGQGGAHRPGQARRADGAAAREMAAHDGARLPARGRAAGPEPTWGGWPRRRTRWRSAGCSSSSWRGPARRGPAGRAAAGRGGGPAWRGGGLMRLHRLELQAFGPYATRQRIDFDRLAASGLFLLEGPTGAGKRTILDAITFALYGGLAGEDVRRGPAPVPLRRPGRRAVGDAGVLAARRPLPGDPGAGAPAAQAARRGLHHRGHARAPATAGGGAWLSLSSNKAEAGDLITEIVGLSRSSSPR